MRFVFDPEAAKREQEMTSEFFKDEYEEYEVEVEEPIAPLPLEEGPPVGRGGYRGHRDRGDRRGGPYGGYRGDRHYRGGRGRHR